MLANPGDSDKEVLFVMVMSEPSALTASAPASLGLKDSLDRSPTRDTPDCDFAFTRCPIKGDRANKETVGRSLPELPRTTMAPCTRHRNRLFPERALGALAASAASLAGPL